MKNIRRHLLILLSSLFLALMLLLPGAVPCQAASMQGPYTISSALNTSKVLHVSNANIKANANIDLYYNYSGASQIFYLSSEGSGKYSIRSWADSTLALTVAGTSVSKGSNVILAKYSGKKSQLWTLKSTGVTSEYYIISSEGGYYLDVTNGKTADKTNIRIYTGTKTKGQRWRLTKPYSMTSAVSYALKYTDNSGKEEGGTYNTAYKCYTKDCTNYASQCLLAGGILEGGTWHRVLKNTTYNTKKHASWTLCSSLYRYIKNTLRYPVTAVTTVSAKNTRKGDIVFLDTTGNGSPNHTIICTKISGSSVYYCGHSNWRRNKQLTRDAYYHAWVVHMPF